MAVEVDLRTAVDRRRGFIYFRVPKAANSTIIVNLLDQVPDGPSKHAKRAFDRASSLSREEVSGLAERFFLFSVVRDPYTRVVSAYLDKILRRKPRADKVRTSLSLPAGTEISFTEFCRYLYAGGVDGDPHWYRQVDLIPCGHEMLHFVGRVESLADDLGYITRRIDGQPLPRERLRDSHRTGAGSCLEELYTTECIDIVRTVYAADFATFGYPEEPAW